MRPKSSSDWGEFPPDYHLVEDLSVTRLLYIAQQVIHFETVFLANLTDASMAVLASLHIPMTEQRCTLNAPATVPLEQTYCQFVYRSGKPLVVADARHTLPYAQLATTQANNIGAYIGVPLVCRDGTIFGTLCGLHPEPKTLTTNQIMLLQIVGKALIDHIERDVSLTQMQADAAYAKQSLDKETDLPDRMAFEYALQAAILQAAATARPLTLIMMKPLRMPMSEMGRYLQQRDVQAFAYDESTLALLLPEMMPDATAKWAATLLNSSAWAGIAAYPALASSQQILVARAREALTVATEHSDTSPIVIWLTDPHQLMQTCMR